MDNIDVKRKTNTNKTTTESFNAMVDKYNRDPKFQEWLKKNPKYASGGSK